MTHQVGCSTRWPNDIQPDFAPIFVLPIRTQNPLIKFMRSFEKIEAVLIMSWIAVFALPKPSVADMFWDWINDNVPIWVALVFIALFFYFTFVDNSGTKFKAVIYICILSTPIVWWIAMWFITLVS